MRSYQELLVWQESMKLSEMVYSTTESFPRRGVFALSSQIRRATVSIPSNIAEGYGRSHRQEYVHFLRIAYGSSLELETQLLLAQRLGYLNKSAENEVFSCLTATVKMLKGLINSLT